VATGTPCADQDRHLLSQLIALRLILPALGIPTPLSRDRAIGSGDQLQRRDEALTRLPLSNYLASVNGVVEDFVDVESTKRSVGTAFTAMLDYLRRHSAPCRTILWKRRIKEMNRFRDDDDPMTVASWMGPESIGPCISQRSEIDNSVRHSLRTLRLGDNDNVGRGPESVNAPLRLLSPMDIGHDSVTTYPRGLWKL
jgi:hypothetical protein